MAPARHSNHTPCTNTACIHNTPLNPPKQQKQRHFISVWKSCSLLAAACPLSYLLLFPPGMGHKRLCVRTQHEDTRQCRTSDLPFRIRTPARSSTLAHITSALLFLPLVSPSLVPCTSLNHSTLYLHASNQLVWGGNRGGWCSGRL